VKVLLLSAALALTALPAAAQPGEWKREYRRGGYELKEERKRDGEYRYERKGRGGEVKFERKANGEWKEELKQGSCEIKREYSLSNG